MPVALIVSAVTSLTEVLTRIGQVYEARSAGSVIRLQFAASGTLLQQIRQGAPVDLFICASTEEVDPLARERHEGLAGVANAIPGMDHIPTRYPAAARRFLAILTGVSARALFRDSGFSLRAR